MDPGLIVFLVMFGLVVALIASWVVGRMKAWKRRAQAIAEWARRLGLELVPGPMPTAGFADLPSLQLTGDVTLSEASNVARGRRGERQVSVFDLRRQSTSRSPSGRTHSRSLNGTHALFTLRRATLPAFQFAAVSTAAPGSLQARMLAGVTALARTVGGDRAGKLIELPGRPGFLLTSDDADEARVLFPEPVLQFFDANPGFTVEGEDATLLVGLQPGLQKGWRPPRFEGLLAHEDLDAFLAKAEAIVELIARA